MKNILGELSLKSVELLKLHFDQMIKHHVENKLGLSIEEIYDGDDFCELIVDDSDMMVSAE